MRARVTRNHFSKNAEQGKGTCFRNPCLHALIFFSRSRCFLRGPVPHAWINYLFLTNVSTVALFRILETHFRGPVPHIARTHRCPWTWGTQAMICVSLLLSVNVQIWPSGYATNDACCGMTRSRHKRNWPGNNHQFKHAGQGHEKPFLKKCGTR